MKTTTVGKALLADEARPVHAIHSLLRHFGDRQIYLKRMKDTLNQRDHAEATERPKNQDVKA
jgi:hypothetical protein